MRYIINTVFISALGEPMKLRHEERGIDTDEATVGQMLTAVLDAYDTNHLHHVRAGQVLSSTETIAFNEMMKILEVEPQEEGYYRLESKPHFELLEKLVGWVAPIQPWWRNGPIFAKLLKEAPAELPKETDNNGPQD